jgi:Ca-activated chloride channel family protein
LVLSAAPVLPILKAAALVLLILALARPQRGVQERTITGAGIDIVLAVDLSESMAALDFKREGKIVNRLEAVKGVIRRFIPKRRGDRIAVVVFGSEAYTQMPLTRDLDTLVTMVERLEIGAAGRQTALGDALGISIKRLADAPGKSRVVILLTDGRSNTGVLSTETAAKIAAESDIKVYTIGVGTKGKVPFRVASPAFGDRYVYRRVDLDETTLTSIAETTGGMYFRARDVAGLSRIYETIDRMEKTEVKMKVYEDFSDWYFPFLVAAFFLFFLRIILDNTRYLRVP